MKRNETTEVGNDRSEQVAGNENLHIGNNRTETVTQDEDLTVNRDQLRHIGQNRITKIEKDEILNINNSYRLDVQGDTHIQVGNDLTIEVAQNGTWHAGELLDQICDRFDLEGYEQVTLQGPGGTIIINREGIELIGNVYVEGELHKEGGAAEGVNPFDIQVNDEDSFYKIQFRMLDDQGNPYVNVPFSILLSEGEQKGITDLDGLTPIYYTRNEESVKCRLHIEPEEEWEWDTK